MLRNFILVLSILFLPGCFFTAKPKPSSTGSTKDVTVCAKSIFGIKFGDASIAAARKGGITTVVGVKKTSYSNPVYKKHCLIVTGR